MSVPQILVDTNVILRFVLNDDLVQTPIAYTLMARAAEGEVELLLTEGVLVECAWVLRNPLRIPLDAAAAFLHAVLASPGLVPEHPSVFRDAVTRMEATGHDLVDCLLAARGAAEGLTIASFDGHLRRHRGVTVWPEA